jgi:hypothetical protein
LLDLLVTSTLCEGLVLPMVTLPKSRLLGLTLIFAFGSAKTAAGAAMLIKKRAKLKTENAKIDDFGRTMTNPPKNCAATNVYEIASLITFLSSIKNVPDSVRIQLPTPQNGAQSASALRTLRVALP